jgi:hypothetical protein
MKQLNESLEYLIMKNHVTPLVGIDQYKSTVGEDSEMIVLNFIVDDENVATDLVSWFEKGYDWIVDAEPSPGEVRDNKYYVFVEMDRRSSAPERIIELLDDLRTLTELEVDDWKVRINNKDYPVDLDILEKHMVLSAADYRRKWDEPLNEWKSRAGLRVTGSYDVNDQLLREWQHMARIKRGN